jgi:hypothetical protein
MLHLAFRSFYGTTAAGKPQLSMADVCELANSRARGNARAGVKSTIEARKAGLSMLLFYGSIRLSAQGWGACGSA